VESAQLLVSTGTERVATPLNCPSALAVIVISKLLGGDVQLTVVSVVNEFSGASVA
jgi:hypothetical protein